MERFVFSELLPTIDLTPDKAEDVDTSSFEQKQDELSKWKAEAEADREKIFALQKEIKKTKEPEGPCQKILSGIGLGVDNLGSAFALPVSAIARAISGRASSSQPGTSKK